MEGLLKFGKEIKEAVDKRHRIAGLFYNHKENNLEKDIVIGDMHIPWFYAKIVACVYEKTG